MIFAFFADKSDVVSVSSDVILDVAIERFEQFDEANCKGIAVSVIRFAEVVEGVGDFCDEDEHTIADFSADSDLVFSVESRRFERFNELFASKDIADTNI